MTTTISRGGRRGGGIAEKASREQRLSTRENGVPACNLNMTAILIFFPEGFPCTDQV